MSNAIQTLSVQTFAPVLGSLSAILVKAADHAAARGIEPETLVRARLAPDMYDLAQQVRTACNMACGCIAQLTGQAAPAMADDEQTLEALKARIDATIDWLRAVPAGAFAGAEERRIVIPVPGGEFEFHMGGEDFVRDWSLPHFYFHVVTAYDILRHAGLELSKRDYMAHVARYLRPAAAAADA
jgi:hypothetical protein